MSTDKIIHINSRGALRALARELRVRHDWHEPDEQNLEAVCFGDDFDNAGFWGRDFRERQIRQKFRLAEEMKEESCRLKMTGTHHRDVFCDPLGFDFFAHAPRDSQLAASRLQLPDIHMQHVKHA